MHHSKASPNAHMHARKTAHVLSCTVPCAYSSLRLAISTSAKAHFKFNMSGKYHSWHFTMQKYYISIITFTPSQQFS